LGLIVDPITGEQEIVIKPFDPYFKKIKGLSGVAILGNGSAGVGFGYP
jgi:chemotaxis protein histidine kinase CheA